ncbi:MAG: CBS domain-containing protein [Endozoicomonas sp. (ex Botrylloides leachii)]|nr:CBS domain-containing protein [Endozoicomonas sp. (ex Botrylloides leachii)]
MRKSNPLLTITAKDIMTRQVVTVPYDSPIDQLARLFTDKSISGAPVVDREGKILGVVTASDIVRQTGNGNIDLAHRNDDFYQSLHDTVLSEEERHVFHQLVDLSVLANDIMTPIVFEVAKNTPLDQVAEVMVTGRIHRVLVTDNRQVKGIISALDLLKCLTQ